MGRPHSADKKFVRARGPKNWNPEVFDQTRCSRILHVEFPLNNRELVKAEVFEKRVFEQTTPFKLRNEGRIFLEQPFGRNCAAGAADCQAIGTHLIAARAQLAEIVP